VPSPIDTEIKARLQELERASKSAKIELRKLNQNQERKRWPGAKSLDKRPAYFPWRAALLREQEQYGLIRAEIREVQEVRRVADAMQEIGQMHADGDVFFAIQPDTRLYLVASLSDGTLCVTGYTYSGGSWTHSDVPSEQAARWFGCPPFSSYSLVGREATHLLVVDTQTRKLYAAAKDAVAVWTWFLLHMLRGYPAPATRFLH